MVAVLAGLAEGEEVLIDTGREDLPVRGDLVLSAQQVDRKVSTTVVQRQDIPHAVTLGGRLTFDDLRVTHVFPPVGGRITRILAAPGDHVKRGTPLAIILSPDLGSAFSDELKAKADLVAAGHERRRQHEMYALRASAQRDVEAAEDSYDKAKAEYDRAAQKTRLLRQGALDSVSQEFVLRSPIEGEVIARMANPGLEVQGQYSGGGNVVELFTIGKLDRLWLLGEAYEVDLPYLRSGAEMEVQVSGYPGRTFRGTLDWIRTRSIPCCAPRRCGASFQMPPVSCDRRCTA